MNGDRPPHPGTILKQRFLDPLGVSPAGLASSIGVSARRIADLVSGRRGISTDIAVRLGLYFGVPPTWWLDMQARYDTEDAPIVDELREQVKPNEHLAGVLISPNGVQRLPPAQLHEQRVSMVRFPDDLLARLRAQAALEPPRPLRHVRTLTYANGATALVGTDDEPDR